MELLILPTGNGAPQSPTQPAPRAHQCHRAQAAGSEGPEHSLMVHSCSHLPCCSSSLCVSAAAGTAQAGSPPTTQEHHCCPGTGQGAEGCDPADTELFLPLGSSTEQGFAPVRYLTNAGCHSNSDIPPLALGMPAINNTPVIMSSAGENKCLRGRWRPGFISFLP